VQGHAGYILPSDTLWPPLVAFQVRISLLLAMLDEIQRQWLKNMNLVKIKFGAGYSISRPHLSLIITFLPLSALSST
jgi:hypothetical protein